MDRQDSPPALMDNTSTQQKRKRSPSPESPAQPTPPVKAAKTSSSHLQINYLARQSQNILPLISTDDQLPSLLSLIADYDGVLQRHESMAGNLGARPLGPILVQRFERLFDGPPHVLKTHGREGMTVGWLDVVEFARTKPEQFNLEKTRDGVRVCQFYTKQCRVEISEEDYEVIASGMPQKLMPPQPIAEDEEKELGTLEILERNLGGVVQLADQVSARARQLNHRLKNRKNAIISRREAEKLGTAAKDDRKRSPISLVPNEEPSRSYTNGEGPPVASPAPGFVAVNSKHPTNNGHAIGSEQDHSGHTNGRVVNGNSSQGASAATHAELLSKFQTSSDRSLKPVDDLARRYSSSNSRPSFCSKPKFKGIELDDPVSQLIQSSSVPIPSTPSLLQSQAKASPAEKFDDNGPYKADMMLRMEQLNRGDRVQPPCDRCRRLHMDCLKNLTACIGCTKKHSKCSWKDVQRQELKDHPFVPRVILEDWKISSDDTIGDQGVGKVEKTKKIWGKEGQGVRDEELLGEDSDEEEEEALDSAEEGPERPHSGSPPPPTTMNEDAAPSAQPKAAASTSYAHAHPSPTAYDSPSMNDKFQRVVAQAKRELADREITTNKVAKKEAINQESGKMPVHRSAQRSPEPAPPLQVPSASADAPPLAVDAPTSLPTPIPDTKANSQPHKHKHVDQDDRNSFMDVNVHPPSWKSKSKPKTESPLDERDREEIYHQLKAAAVEAESGVSGRGDERGAGNGDGDRERKVDGLRVYTAGAGGRVGSEDEGGRNGNAVGRDENGGGVSVGIGRGAMTPDCSPVVVVALERERERERERSLLEKGNGNGKVHGDYRRDCSRELQLRDGGGAAGAREEV